MNPEVEIFAELLVEFEMDRTAEDFRQGLSQAGHTGMVIKSESSRLLLKCAALHACGILVADILETPHHQREYGLVQMYTDSLAKLLADL